MPYISEIWKYPVKSMRGIRCEKAHLTRNGILHDRRWMVINSDFEFITQRNVPELTWFTPEILEENLRIYFKNGQHCDIPFDKVGEIIRVPIWDDSCDAIDQGNNVAEWINTMLPSHKMGPFRLVRFCDKRERAVSNKYLKGQESATTFFADGYPYLITTTNSLDALNSMLTEKGAEPIPMNRFRANIVISDAGRPFIEDQSDSLISYEKGYSLAIRKPCTRCVITTTDQQSGKRENPKEPLASILKIRKIPGFEGALFGQNAILSELGSGVIEEGDMVSFE